MNTPLEDAEKLEAWLARGPEVLPDVGQLTFTPEDIQSARRCAEHIRALVKEVANYRRAVLDPSGRWGG